MSAYQGSLFWWLRARVGDGSHEVIDCMLHDLGGDDV